MYNHCDSINIPTFSALSPTVTERHVQFPEIQLQLEPLLQMGDEI
jgi:hypothetical protein